MDLQYYTYDDAMVVQPPSPTLIHSDSQIRMDRAGIVAQL